MPRLVRKDDPTIAIIGIADLIPAIAYISDATTSLTELEYEGESHINWDNQHHQQRNGLRIFIDANDQEVLEDQVIFAPEA